MTCALREWCHRQCTKGRVAGGAQEFQPKLAKVQDFPWSVATADDQVHHTLCLLSCRGDAQTEFPLGMGVSMRWRCSCVWSRQKSVTRVR